MSKKRIMRDQLRASPSQFKARDTTYGRVSEVERPWRWVLDLCLAAQSFNPAEAEMYKGHETPAYTVEPVGEAEIRSYPPVLVAEVTATGSRSGAASEGFRALAGYIFGDNAGAEKMAMTTPVAQAPQAGATWTMRFMMPADRTLASLPRPGNSAVRLVELPPRRVIVLRFSGSPSDNALSDATDRLRAIAAEAGLTLRGKPDFMFYDSPFTLPWNRRNEVAFVLG
jgi:hypothetical protein